MNESEANDHLFLFTHRLLEFIANLLIIEIHEHTSDETV